MPIPPNENYTGLSSQPAYNDSDKKMAGDFANKILRGELSAIEAYEQVIQKFSKESNLPVSSLRRICADHEDSCGQIRQVVSEEQVKASKESGAWGGFVKSFVSVAGLFGDHGAIRALKTGEEHGLQQYEEALGLELNQWEKNMIQNVLIPKQKEHISQLESLLNKH